MSNSVAARLEALGIALPRPAVPVANYAPFVLAGGLLTISGQLPLVDGRLLATGIVGADLAVADAIDAARASFINVLAQAEAALGDLERVVRVVRLGGFIASGPDFTRHAEVMNGASDLAVAAFGDRGRHARSTVGVASLPLGAPVEIEALFAVA
jgi:enamine deaminase RidA (YjgF/YER057c/UK114 family)